MSVKRIMLVLSRLINYLHKNKCLTLDQFNSLVVLQTSEKSKKTKWKKVMGELGKNEI